MPKKIAVMEATLINGFLEHDCGRKSLRGVDEMKESSLQLDDITVMVVWL